VLIVNDQEVARVHDEALREGTLAFGVGHSDGEHVEGRFSNLSVTAVD
jgi:hypothetical protein